MRYLKIFYILIGASMAMQGRALPTYEAFQNATDMGGTDYASGEPLSHQTNALGEYWAQWTGSGTAACVLCTNTGLSYSGYPAGFPAPSQTNAAYLPGTVDGGTSGLSAALNFSKVVAADPNNFVTNAICASFLLKVSNLGKLNSGSAIYFGGFATNSGDQNVGTPSSAMKIFLKGNSLTAGSSTTYSVGVADNSGSSSAVWDGGGHSSNDVLFVVVAYRFGINSDYDIAQLWVNPSSNSFGLPVAPLPTGTINVASGNAIAQAADFFLLVRGGSTLWGSLLLSDLRVGQSWSYVTGGPEITLPTGPILSITPTAASWVLSCGNGVAGRTNILLSSTDLLLAKSNWTPVATNVFDANGCVSFPDANPPAVSRFYALKMLPPVASPRDLWIPSSGAWLGAVLTNATTWDNGAVKAVNAHEAMIGRQLDILREYWPSGSWTGLTSTELNYINAGRKVFISFKPGKWSDCVGAANGGSASIDSQLAGIARSVASVKPKQIMLCVWHEPQNDVDTTTHTTNQYVAMWRNVRTIFAANGANNVVWVWNVQGPPSYRSLVPALWPGNEYVDWVTWDRYQGSSSEDMVWNETEVYNWFVSHSDATHNYLSKPWGWAEWGIGINGWLPTATQQASAISAINNAVNAGQWPRVHYIAYFDSNAGPNATSAIIPGAWGAYSNFANSSYMTQQCPP